MILHYFKRGLALAAGAALLASCSGNATAARAPKASAVTPEEVAQLKAEVAPLVDKSPGTVIKTAGPNGLVVTHFTSGHNQVMVARRNQDGSFSTACVDSVSGLERALTAPAPTPTATRRWEVK